MEHNAARLRPHSAGQTRVVIIHRIFWRKVCWLTIVLGPFHMTKNVLVYNLEKSVLMCNCFGNLSHDINVLVYNLEKSSLTCNCFGALSHDKNVPVCKRNCNFDLWNWIADTDHSNIVSWVPEGHTCCTKSMAIAPFWFSTGHHWKVLITLFWWKQCYLNSQDSSILSYKKDNPGIIIVLSYWIVKEFVRQCEKASFI